MISDPLRQALRDSLNRLAIVGRFSYPAPGKPARNVVWLSNGGRGAGPVSVNDFFRLVAPQLRLFAQSTVTIGKETFNWYNLKTPAQAEATGQEQAILADSPLFASDETPPDDVLAVKPTDDIYQIHQKRGGRLYRKLLGDLDVIARFSHPNFARGLLALARHYTGLSANKVELKASPKRVDVGRWRDLTSEDQRVGVAIIRVLTGYPGDDRQHLEEFERLLNDPTRGAIAGLDAERVKALSGALARLKGHLSGGPVPPVDDTLTDLAKPGNFPWLLDYPAHPAYYTPKTGVNEAAAGAGRKDFFAYYRTFRLASDAVHRFVRTAALHPYQFAWLTSKYRSYGLANKDEAAKEAFRVGVEGQAERVYGEGADERRQNRAEVERVFLTLPAEAQDLREDANYKLLRELARDSVAGVMLQPTAFTRDILREVLTETFALLYGLTSAVGELLQQLDAFNEQYRPVYQAILAAEPAAGALTVEDFRRALERRPVATDPNFIAEVLAAVPADAEDLRRAVKNAFIGALQRRCDVKLLEIYRPVRGRVTEQDALARRLYRFRLLLDVAGAGQAAGAPAVTVTPIVLAQPGESAGDTTARRPARNASYHAAAKALGSQVIPNRVAFPVPEQDVSVLEPNKKYTAQTPAGEVVGWVEVSAALPDKDNAEAPPRAGQVVVTLTSPDKASELFKPDTTLKSGNAPLRDAEGNDVTIVGLKLRGLDAFDPPELRQKPEKLGGEFDILADAFKTFTERYVSDDSQEQTDRLRRGLRSLILGEYLLAAPPDTVNLNVDDLSQGLGIMVDMAKHVGDADPRKGKVFANQPDEATTNRLPRINLSRLYPVSSRSEMETVLQYQLDLCDNVDQVREYLDELQDLKSFLGAVAPTGLDVIVVNQTLAQHAALPAAAMLVVCTHKPAVVYLTRQAFKPNGSPATDLNALATRVVAAIPIADPIVPIVVAPIPVADGTTALPVIDARPLASPGAPPNRLPELRPGRPGLNVNTNEETYVTRPTQAYPFLPLAASLSSAAAAFGNLARQPPTNVDVVPEDQAYWVMPDIVGDRWEALLNVSAGALGAQGFPGQPLSRLFRMAWSEFPKPAWTNLLFNTAHFTRLLNLAVLAHRSGTVQNLGLATHFGQIVQSVLADAQDRATAAAGLDGPFAAALQPAAFQYQIAGGGWSPVPANPVPLTAAFRGQRATGLWVELTGVDWKNNFAALLLANG